MPTTPDLDGTDREILDLLREDARRTLADIGERVSLSAPAVKRRIDRLEAIGVITGYTVIVDEGLLGFPLEAFTELRFAGSAGIEEIASTVSGMSEVEAFYLTAGDPDAILRVRVRDVEHLQRVIDHLRRSRKVTGTKTLMVLGGFSGPEARDRPPPIMRD
jgi:Lrp/AsnC family leucine-responsive transcriptional regulator